MNLTDKINLKFLKVTKADVDLLFNWINDSEVRAQSLSTHNINYSDHTTWFAKKLADKNCYIYIVYNNETTVGMVRFDVQDNECIISYLVDGKQRGKGIGTSIIDYGMQQFKQDSCFTGNIVATVKNSNIASLKIFEKAEFEKCKVQDGFVYFKKYIGNERN